MWRWPSGEVLSQIRVRRLYRECQHHTRSLSSPDGLQVSVRREVERGEFNWYTCSLFLVSINRSVSGFRPIPSPESRASGRFSLADPCPPNPLSPPHGAFWNMPSFAMVPQYTSICFLSSSDLLKPLIYWLFLSPFSAVSLICVCVCVCFRTISLCSGRYRM